MQATQATLADALLRQITTSCEKDITVSERINNTKKYPNYFRSNSLMQDKLAKVTPLDDKPYQWIYSRWGFNTLIDLQEECLYSDIKNMHHLISKIKKNKLTHCDTLNTSLDTVEPISFFASVIQRYLMPYCAAGIDCPSKFRAMDLIGIFACFKLQNINTHLFRFLPKDTFEYYATLVGLSLIISLLAFREGFLLKEQKLRTNLQGIERRIKGYCSFPPTCIGQQLTAKTLFIGENENLRASTYYLKSMLKIIDEFSSNQIVQTIPVWPELLNLRKKIGQYMIPEMEMKSKTNKESHHSIAVISL